MRIKTLTITGSLALFLLAAPHIALAQKDGEAQSVFFDAGDRPTLRFTDKSPKTQHCGAFVTYTLMDDNREEAIALRVAHLHVAGMYFRPSLHEGGWLYITPSRIVFRVEEGDTSHAFDIPRTMIKEKKPFEEIYASYNGIQLNLKEKLPGSNSSEQKFVFYVVRDKRCGQLEASPYRHFIQRAVKDFNGAVAEFKRVAGSLKQSGRIQQAPASLIPPGNSGGRLPPPATSRRRVLGYPRRIDFQAVRGLPGQNLIINPRSYSTGA
jgi:hypothetical protein